MTSAYVDRSSKLFHARIQQEMYNKPTTPYICCYTTLRNLKCQFFHFPLYSCYKNIHRIYLFLLVNVIDIVWHILPQHASDSTVNCYARSAASSLYSSRTIYRLTERVYSLGVSVSHLNLLKWETPIFISSGLWPQQPDLNPGCLLWLQIIHMYILTC